MSAPHSDRIGRFGAVYTHALYLVDAKGEKRGGLGFNDEGCPSILLFDEAGTLRVSAHVERSGAPVFYLADGSGRPRLMLQVRADGTVGLRLTDHAARPRVIVGLESDGRPCMGVLGTQGDELGGWPMRPKLDALSAELLDHARREDRDGFRLALERAGVDLDDLEVGWQAARAQVAEGAPSAPPSAEAPA
jgi:hypothetical protein